MLSIAGEAQIFLCQDPINMHISFEGLSSLVEGIFKEEVTSGAYFVFINRQRNMIKILYWDSDGLAIWYKRLEKGSFPRQNLEGFLMDRKNFLMMLEGVVPRRIYKRYKHI